MKGIIYLEPSKFPSTHVHISIHLTSGGFLIKKNQKQQKKRVCKERNREKKMMGVMSKGRINEREREREGEEREEEEGKEGRWVD